MTDAVVPTSLASSFWVSCALGAQGPNLAYGFIVGSRLLQLGEATGPAFVEAPIQNLDGVLGYFSWPSYMFATLTSPAVARQRALWVS